MEEDFHTSEVDPSALQNVQNPTAPVYSEGG